MKKKLFKVILIITVTVALMCCCCFSVSAASDFYSGSLKWNDKTLTFSDSSDGPLYMGPDSDLLAPYDSFWVNGFISPSSDGVVILFPFNADINLGSTFSWNSFSLSLWNRGSVGLPIQELNLILLEDLGSSGYGYNYYRSYRELATKSVNNTSFWQGVYSLPGGKYVFDQSINIAYVGIEIRFYSNIYSVTDTVKFSFNDVSINVSCGDPNSPYYPGYESPSDDSVSSVGALEDQIADNAADGLDSAADMFTGFSGIDLRDPLSAVVQIYNCFLPRLSWLELLLTISLTLGLVGFLLGIAQLIVTRANARDRENNRRKG